MKIPFNCENLIRIVVQSADFCDPFNFPSLCYRSFFDDYEIFVILVNQLLVIHEISKNKTELHTFLKQKPSAFSC